MAAHHRPLEGIDIELIERIKLSPCLYDARHPDFRFVYRKDYQWQRIGDTLGMSDSEAKRRWTVLRDRYARELKQMHLNPHSTVYGKNEFFVRMDFLRKFVKKRRERKRIGVLRESVVPLKVVKMECGTLYPFETMDIAKAADDQMKHPDYSDQETNNKFTLKEEVEQDDFEEPQEVGHGVYEYEECGDSYESVMLDKHETSFRTSASNIYQKASMEVKPSVRDFESSGSENEKKQSLNYSPILKRETISTPPSESSSDSDELFSKVLSSYLKNLSRRYKIKAKVEMMQIVEKYIEIEENERPTT